MGKKNGRVINDREGTIISFHLLKNTSSSPVHPPLRPRLYSFFFKLKAPPSALAGGCSKKPFFSPENASISDGNNKNNTIMGTRSCVKLRLYLYVFGVEIFFFFQVNFVRFRKFGESEKLKIWIHFSW